MEERKGFKQLDLGETGQYVAIAIREYRTKQQMTIAALEQRLTDAGHRIHAVGLRRIEAGARRVDVDDLMAIAAALNVSPLRLLLYIPEWGQGVPYQVATGVPNDLPWNEAQAWVRDETGLSLNERIAFWKQEIRANERLCADGAERLEALEAQTQANPGDTQLLDRQHRALGMLSLHERNHALAVEMLNELEAKGADMN